AALGQAESARQIRAAPVIHRERRGHEIAPDLRRDRSAADLAERLVVVAANPDADDEVAGKADEQGVAILLRSAGLAEGRHRQRRAAAGTVVGGGIEQVEHRRAVAAIVEAAAARAE